MERIANQTTGELPRGKDRSLACWLGGLLNNINSGLLILFLILLITPIFQPDTIAHLDDKTFIKLWRLWRLASCFIILTVFFFVGKKDVFTYCAILFSITVLVSTILNEGSVMEWVYRWIPIMAAVALVAVLVNERSRELLIALYAVTVTMAIFNLISILLFPEGTYGIVEGMPGQRFFFGNRNNTYQILIPSVLSGCLLDHRSGRKIPCLTLSAFAIALIQVVLMRAATSTVAIICLAVFLLLAQGRLSKRIMNSCTYLMLSLIAFFLIVIFRLGNALSFIVVGVFQKDVTFTGRTNIWDMVLQYMDGEHALWGYGLSGYKLFENKLYTHAHNDFLNVWFVGGLVGIVLFSCLLVLVTWSLYKNRQSESAAVIAATLGSLYVIGVFEQLTTPAFFFVCAFAYYCKSLQGQCGRHACERRCSERETGIGVEPL